MTDARTVFLQQMIEEVGEAAEEGGGKAAEFTRLILDRLAEAGFVENPVALWAQGSFGAARFRISGYALDEEQERLVLFTTIFIGEQAPRALTLDEIKTAVERAARFFLECARGRAQRIDPPASDAGDLARLLAEIHHRISFLRVVVLSDGLVQQRRLEPSELEGTRTAADLLGLERLHRILGEGRTREHIVVDIEAITGGPLPALPVRIEDAGYEAWLAAVPGEVLARAYEDYGGQLLELNVRAFLGVRGRKSVNAGLQQTLESRPADFLAFNNGIVATVDAIDGEERDGIALLKRLSGLQIVNGGQTTASLHRASRALSVDLASVRVPAKIIRVPRDTLSQMVSDISRSANSQNTVQPADFSANDPFHVRVEELANNIWCPDGTSRWFYERARGSYSALEAKAGLKSGERKRVSTETPKELRFSKTDLAKYINAWEGLPHQVSAGSQKNFQLFMQRLKEERRGTPDEDWYRRFISLTILFRAAQKIVREEKFSAYQANIIAYTVSGLGWRTSQRIDFDRIWNAQSISQELAELIRVWAREVDAALRATAGAKMPTEWAKREEAWEQIRALLPTLNDPLPPELGLAGSSHSSRPEYAAAGISAGDLYLIEQCRALSAEQLLELITWGHRNGMAKWQIGILNTVTGYAASSWERSPSVKQARWIIDAKRQFDEANRGAAEIPASA